MTTEVPLSQHWLRPKLGAGAQVVTTTRAGGVSGRPFTSLNLATHVGDAAAAVTSNRRRLLADLQQCGCDAVQWLDQCHGSDCVVVAGRPLQPPPRVDAAVTRTPGLGLAVLTADCLPVVVYQIDGQAIGVAHAGWRGLVSGVLATTVAAMPGPPEQLAVWLGPAIGAARYEVGSEVREAALAAQPTAEEAFRCATEPGKYLFDLGLLARLVLHGLGVSEVVGGAVCCAADERFYSYRRDGLTGRMATVAWLDAGPGNAGRGG